MIKHTSSVMESVLKKLNEGKVDEVRAEAKKLLQKNRDDPEGWFLMGMVSHEKANEGYALECFERALYLKRTEKYHKAKGISHMSLFEFEDAAKEIKHALEFKKDAESHFMLSMALLFLNDEDATENLAEAYRLKPKKTKELLRNFYNVFFKNDSSIPQKEKDDLLKIIG